MTKAKRYRTKYATTGKLSDGSGRDSRMIEIPAGTPCKPRGDGAFWAEGWRQWGGPDLAAGTLGDWDATHYGIVIQGVHVEAVE